MSKLTPNDLDWGESLDAAVYSSFVQRLLIPITNLPAFKLRLIDARGNIKRVPRTREEKRALSFVDRLALMFRQYMGNRTSKLYSDFTLNKQNPIFIRSLMKANTLRFNKYYDMTSGWNYNLVNFQEEKKTKIKKRVKDYNQSIEDRKSKKKEEHQDIFLASEEQEEGE